MTDFSVTSSGNFRLEAEMVTGDYSAMSGKNISTTLRDRLRDLSERGEINLSALSEGLGKNRGYLENFIRKGSPKSLDYEDRLVLLRRTPLTREELEVDIHKDGRSRGTVESRNDNALGWVKGSKRGAGPYEPLPETVYVIGQVQAGAWMEAYQRDRTEWEEMPLQADPRFPGIQRYALKNVGESMNQECDDGGIWVYVRFMDLVGQGPQPGNFVIVERRRDGLVEATCKQFRLDSNGKPGLYPCSDDPTFKPIPLHGGEEYETIEVIGRVTDVINRK